MAQKSNIRRGRPAPLTLGRMLPYAAAGVGGAIALWAVFTVALAADAAVAQAAAAVETVVHVQSGGLTADRLACAERGVDC